MSSTSLSTAASSSFTEGDEIGKMFDILRAFISHRNDQDTTIRKLRSIVDGSSRNASLLFDVLVALQPEFDEERKRKEENDVEIRRFLEQLGKEILPSEVLSLELNALGAEEQATRSRIVKSKTRIYYKQLKFNLLREESEGYAKLITELLHPSSKNDEMILTVDCLIGQFNLDPNRVVDIILECFEYAPNEYQRFVRLIRDFNVDQKDLFSILALKFIFCQRAESTPMSLYRLSSILAQENLVDILAVFNLATPTQKEAIEDCKTLAELIRVRSVRAETISSSGASLLASANDTFPISSILGANDYGPEPSTIPAVSFSAAIQCQQNEDKKLAGSKFDDTVLHTNQKLGLLCSVLEHGNLELAKPLFERLPEIYPFGVSRRIAMAVSNIIGYKIEPFYREKYSHYRDNSSFRMKESWERFTCLPQITKDWNSLFNDACNIAFQLGPYIGARHEVSIKLIRLLNLFYDDVEAQSLAERENCESFF
uniref:THO complex subunit 2 N-terminal domain-containing protein n=1 Tax=Meloidogyne incognita TaxID=6306 RepID=A0A914L7A5_MELIC